MSHILIPLLSLLTLWCGGSTAVTKFYNWRTVVSATIPHAAWQLALRSVPLGKPNSQTWMDIILLG
jgi:hypothetical protein